MTWKRVATAAVLIPAVVAMVWWGPLGLVALVAAAAGTLALLEFFGLTERAGLRAYRLWTLVGSASVFLAQWAAVPLELVLFIFVVGLAIVVFASRRPLGAALGDIGASATGVLFIALPLSAVVRLAAVEVIGRRLLLFALVLVWVGDTLAFFVGRHMGRLRMAPGLSAAKTWEGAAANLFGSLAVGVVFADWLQLDPVHTMIMAGLASVAGQVGDLLESAYKRSAGVKDSGTLLPGHGGVLDRIDALILAAPVVWYYFELVLAPRT
jgi:phosphatidate cytidylyltransferase